MAAQKKQPAPKQGEEKPKKLNWVESLCESISNFFSDLSKQFSTTARSPELFARQEAQRRADEEAATATDMMNSRSTWDTDRTRDESWAQQFQNGGLSGGSSSDYGLGK